MWKGSKKAPVWEFLGWLGLIWLVCSGITLFLEPYSLAFAKNGVLTSGYVFYAVTGVFFDTPSPMIATYIVLKRHKKIGSVKDFCKLIFHAPSRVKTILMTAAFCAAALCVAIFYGTPTGAPWHYLLAALPLMVLGGGVEEIGWRGFLQPALEKKFPFPLATIFVAVLWYAWHLPLWLLPSSNHYGDSLVGFGIMVLVWSFVGAALYKATKSVFACVMYHAFINTLGAVYDWNALFDAFPNRTGMYVYYGIMLVAAAVLWVMADKKDKKQDAQARAVYIGT